jgi:hypothetical protein
MEKWGKPPPPPPPPPPPSGGSADSVQPPSPKVGFAKAFTNLAGRKLRELRGLKWDGGVDRRGRTVPPASERARLAEANRRAAKEMARRIERQTGRRPKESTIRRAARENRTPRGADQARLDRQSRVDAAGGVKQFADKAGVPAGGVPGWIERGQSMGVGKLRITTNVTGDLYSGSSTPYVKTIDAVLYLEPPAADEFRAAAADGDLDALAEMLGPVIDAQYPWTGDIEVSRQFIVTEINSLTIE